MNLSLHVDKWQSRHLNAPRMHVPQ